MIDFQHISKTYNRGKANEVKAINSLNLHIQEKDFVVVVGANGSGKSTLLDLVAGSISADEGTLFMNGKDVSAWADYKRSALVARVFQNPFSGTCADLSILDNFRLAALRTQNKTLKIGINTQFKKRVSDEIAQLGMGLENKLAQPMGSLSGGQRQALTLLMAVMDDLKILLLDEPTAALDPRSAEVVLRIAHKLVLQYSLTAILITHNLKDAFQHGNRILQLAEGKIVRDLNHSSKNKLTQNEIFSWFS